MRLLRRLFSSVGGSPDKEPDWVELNDLYQLDELVTNSFEKIVVIFKHSTRCGVSSMVLKSFKNEYDYPRDRIELYYLDLLAHRDISNEIANRFQVEHQSPQMIVLKNGKAIYSASHQSISVGILERFI